MEPLNPNAVSGRPFQKQFKKVSLAFCLYVAFYRLVDSMTLHSHGDAFYYHLAGPKTLLNHGWKILREDLQIFAQAGWFDLLYAIPISIFQDPITVQVVAQIMHWGLSAGVAALLFSRWFKGSSLRWVAVIAIMTIGRDFAFLHYAKNDGIVALLALLAVRGITQKWKPEWVGFLLGLIPSIKMSGLLVSGSIGMVLLYSWRARPFDVLKVVGVASLTLMPALYKNFWFTGNPFFPALSNVFRGSVSEEVSKLNQYYFSTKPSWGSISANLFDYGMCKVVCWLAIPLAWFKLRSRRFENFEYLTASVLMVAVYVLTNGTYQGARFFFAAYFLLIAFTFFSLVEFESFWLRRKWVLPTLLLFTLIDGNLNFNPVRIYKTIYDAWIKPTPLALKDSIGQSQYPLLMDPSPAWATQVLSDMRTDYFHLPAAYRFRHVAHSIDASFLLTCERPEDLARLSEYRYFWITRDLKNPCYEALRTRGIERGRVILDGANTAVIEWP